MVEVEGWCCHLTMHPTHLNVVLTLSIPHPLAPGQVSRRFCLVSLWLVMIPFVDVSSIPRSTHALWGTSMSMRACIWQLEEEEEEEVRGLRHANTGVLSRRHRRVSHPWFVSKAPCPPPVPSHIRALPVRLWRHFWQVRCINSVITGLPRDKPPPARARAREPPLGTLIQSFLARHP